MIGWGAGRYPDAEAAGGAPPRDEVEAGQVRKLAGSRHAPGDWILRARMVALSWAGLRVPAIAAELRCHPQTVRERLGRFNADGLDGLGDRPGAGLEPRLDGGGARRAHRRRRSTPPGRPVIQGDRLLAEDRDGDAHWTLDALTAAVCAEGVVVARQPGAADPPQGGGAVAAHPLVDDESGPGLRPKRAAIVALHTRPPAGATVLDLDELGPVSPRTFPRRPGGRRTATGSRRAWSTAAAPTRCGSTARCASATAGP